MRRWAIFAVLLLATAAAPALQRTANSPSFSCVGTLTPAETAICADPELAAWDRAIALLFPVKRKSGELTLLHQREWLDRRDRCGSDIPCLNSAYFEWPGYNSDSGSLRELAGFGRTFTRSGGEDPSDLEILSLGDGWYLFSVQAQYNVYDDRGKYLTSNTGGADGMLHLNGSNGHYKDDADDVEDDPSCNIDFFHQRDGSWTLNDNFQCGGLHVTLTGDYRPDRRRKH